MKKNYEISQFAFIDNVRPSNVTVTSVTTSSVTLTVKPSDSAPVGTTYTVQTTTTTGGKLPDPNHSDPTPNSELTVTGLGPGHGYSFVVSGIFADKTGPFTPVTQTTSMYKVYILFYVLSVAMGLHVEKIIYECFCNMI